MTKQKSFYTTQFWLLCASSVLFMASFNMLLGELPHYLDSIGGQAYKGLIIGLFALAALFSRPFSGRLSDTIGRVPVMIFGAFVCIAAGFIYPLLTTISGFLILRFLHGFSTGFKPTGTTAYLADIIPPNKRGEAMGILGVAGSIGMAAGPAFGSYIANVYSLEIMFWVSSIVAAASILVLMGMKETLPSTVKFNPKLLLIHPKDIIEYEVWVPSLVMLFTAYSFGTILTVTPDFSDHLGLSNRGIFFTITLAASICVRLFSGKASDRLGRENVLLFGTVFLVIAMVILGFSNSPFWFYTGAVIFGIAAGINSPTIFAWTADLGKENSKGKAMSTMFIALEGGILLGAVVGAFFYNNQIEQLKYAYWFGAFLAFLAFLVVLIKKTRT